MLLLVILALLVNTIKVAVMVATTPLPVSYKHFYLSFQIGSYVSSSGATSYYSCSSG